MAYATVAGTAARRRPVGRAGSAGRLRGAGLLAAIVRRPGVDDGADDRDRAGAAGGRRPRPLRGACGGGGPACGVICFVAGLVRLGFLADLLSRPVLIGYMTGVAVIMIGSQLGKVTRCLGGGRRIPGSDAVIRLGGGRSALADNRIGGGSSRGVAGPRAAGAADAGPLIAILGSHVVVSLLSLDRNGIKVVGDIPSGLPIPGFPGISAGRPDCHVHTGRRHRDRRILRQRVDGPHIRCPSRPATWTPTRNCVHWACATSAPV